MNAILPGIIGSVTGAVIAAITSILVTRYQLKRSLHDTTLLAIEGTIRQERAKLREEGRASVIRIMSRSHDIMAYLNNVDHQKTSRAFIDRLLGLEPDIEDLHKEVWLAANRVPASIVAEFYETYREFQAVAFECRTYKQPKKNQDSHRSDPDEDKWLEERKRQLTMLVISFRRLLTHEISWDQELRGEQDFPAHGSPIDYWPGPP